MAQLDTRAPGDFGDFGDFGDWWQTAPGHMPSPSAYDNDWTRMELPSPLPSPRHSRRDVHRSAYSAYSATPSSIATSHQRPAVSLAASLLASPRGMRQHSSASPIVGRPPAASIPFARASTAPTGKRATTTTRPYEGRSRSGSRRTASHRDQSPRSAHHYRSTPDSRRSVRSSFDESERESDTTDSSQDEDDDAADGVYVDKNALRDRLDIRRRSRSQHRQAQDSGGPQREAGEERQRQREQGQRQGQGPGPAQPQPGSSRRTAPRRSTESRGAGTGRSRSRSRRREKVIYEEDAEATEDVTAEEDDDSDSPPRQTASRQTSRAPVSRHTAATQATRFAPKRGKSLRRPDSFDDGWKHRATSRSRPSSRRYCETEIPESYANNPAPLRRAQTQPTAPPMASSPSVGSSKLSVLGGFVGQAPANEMPSNHHACAICGEEYALPRLAKLGCTHRMCSSCLKDKFAKAVSDPRAMPPRCYCNGQIPLKYVEKLFDLGFKRTWNQKLREYAARSRAHCPRCGEWLKPDDMFSADDRKAAQCSKCRTKVCRVCNGPWHNSRQCPPREGSSRFLDDTRAEGRQRCYKCRARTPLHDSQDHVTCGNCGAESCMVCGTKWKTCDCAVFECDTGDTSRSEYTQKPFNGMRGDRFGSAATSIRDFRHGRAAGTASAGVSVVAPARQDDERTFLQRRLHDPRDDELANRMRTAFTGFGDEDRSGYYETGYREAEEPPEDETENYPRRHAESDMGVYSRGKHSFLEDGSRQRSATVILPLAPPPPPMPPTPPQQQAQPVHHQQHQKQPYQHQHQRPHHDQHHEPHHDPHHDDHHDPHHGQLSPFSPAPFDNRPPSGGNYYVAGVNMARGVRENSRDRRLADRFNTDYRTNPAHRSKAPAVPAVQGMMPMSMMSTMSMAPATAPPMTGVGALSVPARASMGGMPMIPMGPMLQQPMPLEAPLMRRHPMEGDVFDSPDLLTSWPEHNPYAVDHHMRYGNMEAEAYGVPTMRGRGGWRRTVRDEKPRSVMAGLTGPDRGMGRVGEWLSYVDPEDLEGETDSIDG